MTNYLCSSHYGVYIIIIIIIISEESKHTAAVVFMENVNTHQCVSIGKVLDAIQMVHNLLSLEITWKKILCKGLEKG